MRPSAGLIACVLLTCAANAATAQDAAIIEDNPQIFDPPLVVPAELRADVPSGWRAILIEKGNFLGDAAPDYAMVVEQDDPDNRLKNEGLGNAEINTNPRVLILMENRKGIYYQFGNYTYFIPSEGDAENMCLADPLLSEGGIAIANKQLKITLGYWVSCGSYGVTKRTHTFRAQGKKMRLIGLDTLSYSRASGEGDETSINFLTGRKKSTSGIAVIAPDEGVDEPAPKPKVKWSTIKSKPMYLDAMKMDFCDGYENLPVWCG
jgi:hypothetical protein